MKITVIIPAYRAQNFIEECLDSVARQTINCNIIVGIDGCEKTKDKLLQIKHKYSNLRVIYFPENRGCYITLNSLIDLCDSDTYIQVFGADDVMHSNMLQLMRRSTPCYSQFSGISLLHKSYYDRLGGYMPWRVAADTEFRQRLKKTEPKFRQIKQLFSRRIHDDQLTRRSDTGMNSKERAEHIKYIEQTKRDRPIRINRVTHDTYEEL